VANVLENICYTLILKRFHFVTTEQGEFFKDAVYTEVSIDLGQPKYDQVRCKEALETALTDYLYSE
jgi:hypothetical protein